mmetsp:Transcript_33977/g.97882  ORF Transcript_33977/g.97882 Transcript_33977/m.97882 type:complete len:84 (-) Transcript_33977:911-1162(-)
MLCSMYNPINRHRPHGPQGTSLTFPSIHSIAAAHAHQGEGGESEIDRRGRHLYTQWAHAACVSDTCIECAEIDISKSSLPLRV